MEFDSTLLAPTIVTGEDRVSPVSATTSEYWEEQTHTTVSDPFFARDSVVDGDTQTEGYTL
jgi:hypothetical protein